MNNNTLNTLRPGTILRTNFVTYTIRRTLGSGGFGITYEAEARQIGHDTTSIVAIKELFIASDCSRNILSGHVIAQGPAAVRFDNSRKDFAGEVKRLRSLSNRHSSIINITDFFEANSTCYYVMDYISGTSLSEYIHRFGPLNETEALTLMLPIIEATAVLHRDRTTHLDIKPSNIMIKDAGFRNPNTPILIDFGLSKHYDTYGQPTSTINTLGYSDGYAPLEQYVGITKFSPATDVYALAATLLFCLSGKTPPKANLFLPQQLHQLTSNYASPQLAEVLRKALEPMPHERIKDADELLHAINFGYKNSSDTIKIGAYTPNKTKSNRPLVILLLILIAILTIGLWHTVNIRKQQEIYQKELIQQQLEQKQIEEQKRQAELERQQAIARRDSIHRDSIRNISSPDLKFFDLHGPVRSVDYTNNSLLDLHSINFDHNHNLISYSPKKQLFHRTNGYITSSGDEDYMDSFEYTWNNNNTRLSIISLDYSDGGYDAILSYNNDGTLSLLNATIDMYGGGGYKQIKQTTTYTDYIFDNFGNWTSRKFRNDSETTIEKRVITYYNVE